MAVIPLINVISASIDRTTVGVSQSGPALTSKASVIAKCRFLALIGSKQKD